MSANLRFPRGLYGITPEWDDTDRLICAVEAAASGGMAALQWRRKTAALASRRPQAQALAARCKELGIVFIVNDDWRMAAAVDADGVHLGREDGLLSEARQALGPDKIIGCSCYNDLSLARQALADGADYIAFGALHPSKIKPDAVRATLEHIQQAHRLAEQATTPAAASRAAIVAIGGITPQNAAPIIQAGADSIALISALFERPDIQAAAAQCQALFV
ncbi:MAG: thiamine phosphate synthase [Burkholderiaceae bacterium]